jgi:hypothetical protein
MGLIDGITSLFQGRPTQENIAKVLNESFSETILMSKSSCTTSVSANQSMTINCTSVTPELAAIYANSAACTACSQDSDREYCEMCYPCAQVGNIQETIIQINSSCSFSDTDTEKAKNELVTGLKQQATTKNTLDPISRFIDGVFGDVTANQSNSTDVTNRIKNSFNSTHVNTAMTAASTAQNISLTGVGLQAGNLQSNTTSIIANSMFKTDSYREAVNTAATEIDQKAAEEQNSSLFFIIMLVVVLFVIFYFIRQQRKEKAKKQQQQQQQQPFMFSNQQHQPQAVFG